MNSCSTHHNFFRQHKSLRVSPAMAAGVSGRMWSLDELVEQPLARLEGQMTENVSLRFRAACYSASGMAQRKGHFNTEDEAKDWAQDHLKGFDKIVIERRMEDRDEWEPAAMLTRR
jgi:hypothetical protein